MKIIRMSVLAALAGLFAATTALAHAHLDHAAPGAGATVNVSPGELQLTFTENLVPAFSGAKLATADGATIATGKATVDPINAKVLHVPLGQKLEPGVYIVNWHVVSVDTHASSGSYKFTLAP